MSEVLVGKIHSPQGVRGELFILIFSGEAVWSDRWQELAVGPFGSKASNQSFKIKKKREHSKQKKWGFALRVEGVDDRNRAEELVGLNVFVPESFLESEEGENIFLREVLNFTVVDQTRGEVGKVVGFSGNAFQDLLVVEHTSGDEFEVPFVEPILVETNKEAKQIVMDIPGGLVPGEEL